MQDRFGAHARRVQPAAEAQLLEHRQLLGELGRHALAPCLIGGVLPVAEGRRGQVERHGDGVGMGELLQAAEDLDKAVDGVGIVPVLRRQQADAVKRAVDQTVSIDRQ